MSGKDNAVHDPYAALRIKEFSLFIAARFFLTLGIQMQGVIVGLQIYHLTRDVLSLGMIGLAEAIPFIIVSLFSGHVADIIERKKIIIAATLTFIVGIFLLLYFTLDSSNVLALYGTLPIFCVIVLIGIARGFLAPAFPSWMAQIVPRTMYVNSSTWNSTVWHVGAIIGPAVAGIIYGFFNITTAYCIDIFLVIMSLVFIFMIKSKPLPISAQKESLIESLSAGMKFVFKNKVILGALSLDLFAVLFGGAVAMIPAFTDQVLHVLPEDAEAVTGFLRAAPALGAVVTAIIMAYFPPTKQAGRNMILAVILFGVSTILFALSSNFYLAFFFLSLTGAFDNVSVVIRHTVLQLLTPENMRGRVSAVNSIFIGSSNEIGAFESGVAAKVMRFVPSLVFGGVMTILVVIGIARLSPKLRKLDIKSMQ